MAASGLSRFLHPQHEGLVRTGLGLAETVALFDSGLPRPKGTLQAKWVSAWRISGPEGGDRFGVEAIYSRGRSPSITTADICEAPAGVDIRCTSTLRWGSWIAPALLAGLAIWLVAQRFIDNGLKDWSLAVGAAFVAAVGMLVWRGFTVVRVAYDHDYILQFLATAVGGERVPEAAA